MLDVCPGSNDRTQHHETEGEQGETRNRAAEPENLTICDEDDGQVLENGVHGYRKELQSLGASVDHADEKEGDREP